MAVVAVPRALRDRLGDDASDSLVDLLQQFEAEQTDHVMELVEERFARRVLESANLLREQMHAGFLDLQKQIGDLRSESENGRAELGSEIADHRAELKEEIASLRTELREGLASLRTELAELRTESGKEIASLRTEFGKEIASLRTELAELRTEFGKEIASLRTELGREIAEVRKEITVQTRWILTVLVAAAVLIPIVQRVMEALLP